MEPMGSATPIDRENVPMSRASLALGEDSSVCGLGEDRQTDRHPSPAQEEMGSTSERKPASCTNCAPALGPPGQTDSSSPGLVQSPNRAQQHGTSRQSRHPLLRRLPKPRTPQRAQASLSAAQWPTSLFSSKGPSALLTDPGFGKSPLRSRLPKPPLHCRDGCRFHCNAPRVSTRGLPGAAGCRAAV